MNAVAATSNPVSCAPGSPVYGEILEFLYREADLLDTQRFGEWIKLFTEDIQYEMPVRTTQHRTLGEGFQDVAFFDENIHSLRTRVKRLETETAWAESPPTRSRHFISNVLVSTDDRQQQYAVSACFLVSRTRGDSGYQFFTGRREDTLCREPGGELRIKRRRILVDQTVITATNLSILF